MSATEPSKTVSIAPPTTRSDKPDGAEKYGRLSDPERIALVARKLEENGFRTIVVDTGAQARAKIEELIPAGAEVFDATSVTLTETGISQLILESGRYRAVRPALMKAAAEGKKSERRRLASSPDYIVGSVHAITQTGQVVVASATGSQLAAYASGAEHVLWVVGAQKIVSDLDDAFRRVYDYALPRESDRAHKAYGVPGSSVAKLLIFNREFEAGRITIVIVKERLGF